MYPMNTSTHPTSASASSSQANLAAELISGTAVRVAGIGQNLTCAPSAYRLSFRPPSVVVEVQRKGYSRFTRRNRGRARVLRRPTARNLFEILEDGSPPSGAAGSVSLIVQESVVKDAFALPASTPRLVGKQGSARRPQRKYYDIDLDQFQSD